MGKVRQYRWWILLAAIAMLLPPTITGLAYPVAQTTVAVPDLSWLAQLSEGLAVLVILAVLLIFVLRFLNDNKKIPDPKDPNTKISEKDMTNRMIIHALNEQSRQTELLNMTLKAFSQELTEGRGNQLTAITDIHDTVNDKLLGMSGALAIRGEQMERVSGGLLHIQEGQTKMQQDLEALLSETHKLTQAIVNILTRLEDVDSVVKKVDQTIGDVSQSTLTIKDEVKELKALFQSLSDRLNKIAFVASNLPVSPMIPEESADPLTVPGNPVEKKDLNVPPIPDVPAVTR